MSRRAGLVLALAACGWAGGATAQPVAPPGPPRPSAPAATGGSVIRPPQNVDPGIKVAPKPTPRLPTPVIRPPVSNGDTVIVPK